MRPRFMPFVAALSLLIACGGSRPPEPANPTFNEAEETTTEAPQEDAGATEERPFAASTAEASAMISAAVDKRQNEIVACVRAFRERKNLAHEKVAVSFGIDMEGSLLGVTSKGKEDAELKTCVHDALRGVLFPRSHAGVITVTKTYEEILQ